MNSKDYSYTFTGNLSPDCHRLEIDHASGLSRVLKSLINDKLEITIKKFYRKRSLAQNNWIWGPCIITIRAWMKETTGVTPPPPEAIYAYIRQHPEMGAQEIELFAIDGMEVFTFKGKAISEMTTVEFSELVERIVLFYGEKGLEIPLPKPKSNNLITDFLDDN